jgi:hypothetical protein
MLWNDAPPQEWLDTTAAIAEQLNIRVSSLTMAPARARTAFHRTLTKP